MNGGLWVNEMNGRSKLVQSVLFARSAFFPLPERKLAHRLAIRASNVKQEPIQCTELYGAWECGSSFFFVTEYNGLCIQRTRDITYHDPIRCVDSFNRIDEFATKYYNLNKIHLSASAARALLTLPVLLYSEMVNTKFSGKHRMFGTGQ